MKATLGLNVSAVKIGVKPASRPVDAGDIGRYHTVKVKRSSLKRLLVAAMGIAALGMLAGCGGSDSSRSGSNPDATVTPKSGSTLSARVGKRFVIKLASNPTTGYQWSVKHAPAGIRFIASNYQSPKKNLAGPPGQQLLTFEPTKAGTYKITLVYERPFAPGDPGKSLTFSVDTSQA